MNTQQINEQRLRRYLLGTLPAAEIEELDERSFLDDDFAARLQSAEDNLIDDYVHGELAADEVTPFNTYFLATPRRREKVQFARSLSAFTARAYPALATTTDAWMNTTTEAAATQAPSTAPSSWWRALLEVFSVPNLTLQWGLAAAALLFLTLGSALLIEQQRLRRQLDQREAERAALTREAEALKTQIAQQGAESEQVKQQLQQVNARLAQLEQTQKATTAPTFALLLLTPGVRGAGEAQLKLRPTTDRVKLRVKFESDDYASYRAEIRPRGGAQPLWRSGKLQARAKDGVKSIALDLPASLFKASSYQLDLTGVQASGAREEIRSYLFKVVKQ